MQKVNVCWNKQDYENLDYTPSDVFRREDMANYDNDIYKISLGNDMYYQPNPLPKFVNNILAQFPYRIKTAGINRMIPGKVLPLHQDLYTRFAQVFGVDDIQKIDRYIVFLEDSKTGHYMQVGSKIINEWKSGDVISWQGKEYHAAFNLGYENRYTLQITCYDKINETS